jgi:hypothetical protein
VIFLKAVGIGVLSYVVGALAGCALITAFSSNRHDRSVEAAMTGAFATGPLLAVIGFVVALVVLMRRRHAARTDVAA